LFGLLGFPGVYCRQDVDIAGYCSRHHTTNKRKCFLKFIGVQTKCKAQSLVILPSRMQ
jgi:hypothetical protein